MNLETALDFLDHMVASAGTPKEAQAWEVVKAELTRGQEEIQRQEQWADFYQRTAGIYED